MDVTRSADRGHLGELLRVGWGYADSLTMVKPNPATDLMASASL